MTVPVIELEQVSKRFGDVHAVERATLTIAQGEVFGLIGHNGAGKSTLIKMMLGLLFPDSGEIRIMGERVAGKTFRQVRRQIAYLPESVVFYDNLTGLETLRFLADLKGADRSQCVPLLDKMGLRDAAGRMVRTYSKGMRQRLGFAQALLGKPAILFLDEPTTGLDPEGIREFYRMLLELKQEGITTVLSSHNLAEIQEHLDRLSLMKHGRMEAVGTVQALRESLDLPMHFRVDMRAQGQTALQRAMAEFEGCRCELAGDRALIYCHQNDKLAVLGILAAMSDQISDIQMREPSLEDVFLGYIDG